MLIASVVSAAALCGGAPPEMDRCDVVWSSPSGDSAGSMPIGNGTVGANVWVERDGAVVALLSRTDAWSETDRLLKLARVRVVLDPSPFAGPGFRQALRLREGVIEVSGPSGEGAVGGAVGGVGGGRSTVTIYVVPGVDQVRVEGALGSAARVVASVETWRTGRKDFSDDTELASSWTMRDAPAEVRRAHAWESADVVGVSREGGRDAVEWFHRNGHSVVPVTLEHQGLGPIREFFRDPLLHRTFGGRLEGDADGSAMPAVGVSTLDSTRPVSAFELRVTTRSAQDASAEAWREAVRGASARSPSAREARETNAAWWSSFWGRSWVIVSGDPPGAKAGGRWSDPEPASRLMRAYALQRWVNACGGGPRDGSGRYPIKFNGSIFTVEPVHTQGQPYDADWRKWGGSFWWQNTRLPYHAMMPAGDFDLMDPLFRYYEDALPASMARTKLYYAAGGVYWSETMTTFASYANGDYGWSREGLAAGDISPCPWWQWAWNPSLELTLLMLDHAVYTGDEGFLRERALPMARETLRYFDSRFGRDGRGRLVITPTQSLETYWHGVVNDTPCLAGLHAVCDRLLSLPEGIGGDEDRALWDRVKRATPEVPVRERGGVMMIAPAERYKDQRNNVETPELYTVWPFGTHGLGRPGLEHALAAYRHRHDRADRGWTQDGIFAACLGLTEEAREQLVARLGHSNAAHRFPAMWGPNFDWLPDQCHGANIMNQTHLMLLQPTPDGKILLLPAWPAGWDVSFRLHAPGRTVVEVEYRGGRVERLEVTPASRRGDVVMPGVRP
ncbi:MAG: hypothetical protein HRU70_02170 [Phycisphaeraceae bacterium]|nr:MAG: hypothetical protein HRU70_02170 [Phycisphaeraceae bacterium]